MKSKESSIMGEFLPLSVSFVCEGFSGVCLQDRIRLAVSSEALSFAPLLHFSSNLYLEWGVSALQE